MDLPRPRHCKLPAELNQQIFLCFHPATQRKFITGLGWDFYAMFRYKLLTKTKRVCNPHGNIWNGINTRTSVATDGLNVSNKGGGHPNVFAAQPFPISGPQCRVDEFPGTICYYYEVKGNECCIVGLSDVAFPVPDDSVIGQYPNSYAIPTNLYNVQVCWLAGERPPLEFPEGANRQPKSGINVNGCGLVLDPGNKLSIFFTLNGKLLARKIPISPTVDRLFPAVTMLMLPAVQFQSIEANFGDDPAKPFEYDTKNCPGLELACI